MGERADGSGRAVPTTRRRRVRAQADEMAALLDAAAPRKRRASGRRAAAVPATAFAVLSLGGVSLVLGFAPTSAGAHLELPDAGAETPPSVPGVVPTGSSGTLATPPAITDLTAGAGDGGGHATVTRAAPRRSAAPARPAPHPAGDGTARAESAEGAVPTTTRRPRTTTSAPRPTTGRSQPATTTATPTTRAGDDASTDPDEASTDAATSPDGFAGRGGPSGDGTDASTDFGGW